MSSISECDSLVFGFPGLQLFDSVSLSFKENSLYSFLGLAQSGKSTLIKLLLGLIKTSEGSIKLFGEDLKRLSYRNQYDLMKKVGVAFQQGALFDHMTVLENLEFTLNNHQNPLSHEEKQERIQWYLNYMKLSKALHKKPNQLSGGMKRRVGVIRSLIAEPELVFLDEPTAGLDPVNSALTIELIKVLQKERKCTMVCVTSIPEVVKQFGGQIYFLYEQKVQGPLPWSYFYNHQNSHIKTLIRSRLIKHES
jgi:phospholipid/cholesterol/gamma-HCH transport system ATP-binding protein